MGKLQDIHTANRCRPMHKWQHYFDIYEHHFARFVGKEVNVLEIGVFQGGSLQMWKHYFGDRANIYGVDINPELKELEEDRIHILIGDQGSRSFWQAVKQTQPVFDIIIDDGGHFMEQQRITLEEMLPVLSPNGVFLVEDMHTSYWPEYGGGYWYPGSFMEYSKLLLDKLNAWHSRDPRLIVDDHTKSVWSMTYYDSVLVIEKRSREKPIAMTLGSLDR